MGKLKILAGGSSASAKAQAKGKLFEKLMAEVLRHLGYSIDPTPSGSTGNWIANPHGGT
jgi:hypothetical protein